MSIRAAGECDHMANESRDVGNSSIWCELKFSLRQPEDDQ